jgi:hypothetical protein
MSKYTIVKDTEYDEYALLYKENFGKVLKDGHKSYAKIAPTLGPEHVFWNGGKKVDPKIDLSSMPKETRDIGIPVIHFYKNKKVYETAMYTSKEAEKRYELIKDVTTKDQFFKYVEAKSQ